MASIKANQQFVARFPEYQDLFEPYGMFELTWVGVPIVIVGMLYMLLVGLRLLPRRGGSGSIHVIAAIPSSWSFVIDEKSDVRSLPAVRPSVEGAPSQSQSYANLTNAREV